MNTQPAAIAAAQWWAEAIKAPRFDNGDPNGMAGMLATLVAARSPEPTEQTSTDFTTALATLIDGRLSRYPSLTVGVDYGPDAILYDAAVAAGISGSRFPWKTVMWIELDHVTVSAGYGAAARLVWASDEWRENRPQCLIQKWDDKQVGRDYHGEPWQCSLPKYHDGKCQFDLPLALCSKCGHPEKFWHDAEDRAHATDLHAFKAAS